MRRSCQWGRGVARVALPEGQTHAEGLAWIAQLEGLPRPELNVVAHAAQAADGEAALSLTDELPDYAGTPVVIAILDTGVHSVPELRSQLLPGADYVNDDDAPDDDNQHGTHLASIIDQVTGGRAVILPVKVLDQDAVGTEFDIAQGIAFAVDQGARVVNLSLSFGPAYVPSDAMQTALRAAEDADVLLVGAAGNDGDNRVGYPAALPAVLAVGAVGNDGDRATYSNYGAALDVLAPGGESNADGGIVGATIALKDPTETTRVALAGTSMAAAYASAIAAVVMAEAPGLQTREVRGLLMETALRDGESFTPQRGGGIIAPIAAYGRAQAIAGDDEAQRALAPTTVAATHVVISGTGKSRARALVIVEVFDDTLGPSSGTRISAAS